MSFFSNLFSSGPKKTCSDKKREKKEAIDADYKKKIAALDAEKCVDPVKPAQAQAAPAQAQAAPAQAQAAPAQALAAQPVAATSRPSMVSSNQSGGKKQKKRSSTKTKSKKSKSKKTVKKN